MQMLTCVLKLTASLQFSLPWEEERDKI